MEARGFCSVIIQFLTCVSEIGFLYIWLRAFSERKRLNRGMVAVILLCSVVLRYCVYGMGNAAARILFGLAGALLLSVLLFHDRLGRLFFYALTNYMLGVTVGVLFHLLLNVSLESWLRAASAESVLAELLFAFIEKGMQFFVYYFIMKFSVVSLPSAEEEKFDWMYYLLFYPVPVISCCFMIEISASGAVAAPGAWKDWFLVVGSLGAFILNGAIVYLFGKFSVKMANVRNLESINLRHKMEERYYKDLDALHEQYDIFLHDIKHMLRTIAALAEDGDYKKIERIITDMRTVLGSIEQKMICSHKVLNALLLERIGYAEECGVEMTLEVKEPLYIQEIDDLDLITLTGNLLDNAIEAERHCKKPEGIICQMHMAREGRHMIIQIENSYEEKERKIRKSIKQKAPIGEKHGIGLGSVREKVKKYGGIIENRNDNGRYFVKVILPVQSEWEEYPSAPTREDTVNA